MPALAQEIIGTPVFRAVFIALSATLPHPLSSYKRKHIDERLTARMIQEQLPPMLAMGRRPDRDELIERAWDVVAPFIELTAKEREYVDLIHDGHVQAELLFPNKPVFAQHIASHPAILWKVANVLQERKKRR
jgi:hypothetical protein